MPPCLLSKIGSELHFTHSASPPGGIALLGDIVRVPVPVRQVGMPIAGRAQQRSHFGGSNSGAVAPCAPDLAMGSTGPGALGCASGDANLLPSYQLVHFGGALLWAGGHKLPQFVIAKQLGSFASREVPNLDLRKLLPP